MDARIEQYARAALAADLASLRARVGASATPLANRAFGSLFVPSPTGAPAAGNVPILAKLEVVSSGIFLAAIDLVWSEPSADTVTFTVQSYAALGGLSLERQALVAPGVFVSSDPLGIIVSGSAHVPALTEHFVQNFNDAQGALHWSGLIFPGGSPSGVGTTVAFGVVVASAKGPVTMTSASIALAELP